MEGTQYERAITVLASYVIGFVTAFIAFGVTQLEGDVKFVAAPSPIQAASVAAARPVTSPAQTATVQQNETGLVYLNGAEEVLLSAYDTTERADGIHVAITQHELSPDGQFVYFCEQGTLETNACTPFLYDVVGEMVYPLKQGGARIALTAEVAQLNWSANGLLSVGATGIDPIR